jgi:hypothetical protein
VEQRFSRRTRVGSDDASRNSSDVAVLIDCDLDPKSDDDGYPSEDVQNRSSTRKTIPLDELEEQHLQVQKKRERLENWIVKKFQPGLNSNFALARP